MPYMRARYAGTCIACGNRFSAGEQIFYAGKKTAYHSACYRKQSEPLPTYQSLTAPEKPAGNVSKEKIRKWVIEWPELKEIIRKASKGERVCVRSDNDRTIQNACVDSSPSFKGYYHSQALDWLESGYSDEALRDVTDFSPPIREKRRYILSDEGDEIDLSAAWSGEDNFLGRWTKRETIPGVSLEFTFGFASSTPAEVVNGYTRWIAQAVFAIEAAGIDPEISMAFVSLATYDNLPYNRLVRVKKENETADLNSWSAMLSPACYRTYGFTAIVLSGDAEGKYVSESIGRPQQSTGWNVKYDSDTGTIKTEIPRSPSDFPAEHMTTKLREAIEALKRNQATE